MSLQPAGRLLKVGQVDAGRRSRAAGAGGLARHKASDLRTWGCSLWHKGLQPLARGAAASYYEGVAGGGTDQAVLTLTLTLNPNPNQEPTRPC